MITEASYSNMMPVDLERELSFYRSGSAPPTVEGALTAVGGLFDGQQLHGGEKIGFRGGLSEEELRSDPAYVNYYHTNVKLNTRLPTPLTSKDKLPFAHHRLSSGAAVGGDRKVMGGRGEGSLFSFQPGFGSNQENANPILEARQSDWGGTDGLIGLPGLEIGTRKNSIAEMMQNVMNHEATASRHPSRPSSRNTFGENLDISNGYLQNHNDKLEFLDQAFSNGNIKGGSSASNTYAAALNAASLSRSATPDPQLIERSPTPRIPPVGTIGSKEKMNISNHNKSFNGGMNVSEDLAVALSGLNLGFGEETHPQSQTPRRFDDHRDFYNFNKYHRSFGHSNGLNSPLSQSMMMNQLEGANLPPFLKKELDHRGFGGNSVHRMTSNQFPLMDPSFVHYAKSNEYAAAQLAGAMDPFFDRDAMGNPYGDLIGLQKAYLDALLASQKSQYGNPYIGKSGGGYTNGYNGNMTCSMNMSYSPFANSPPRNGERNMRYHSGARGGFMGAWHQDIGVGLDENFVPSLLDEFKSNKAKCFELSEIAGHVVQFSADQYGSRFIQQKLETASTEEKDMVFHEIMPQALTLMTDVFGNYVIQKFFEHGSAPQIRELAEKLYGKVLDLSLQMYGCRVIQKAIEVVEVDQQKVMVRELDGHVMRCVKDQNGNHVIQKCIECIPEEAIEFVVTGFYDNVVTLSMHSYGCRVIQRILEHCHDPKTQQIMMDEILQSVCMLAQDQYGNYVVQHVLEHGKPHERTAIIKKLTGQIVHMSQQKFASNVIEKCLAFGTPAERKNLVNEMLGASDEVDPLQVMMKDQFANYVVQKVLETCDGSQLEIILNRIKTHLTALKKYTYGKHIVARVEKLVATGEQRILQAGMVA